MYCFEKICFQTVKNLRNFPSTSTEDGNTIPTVNEKIFKAKVNNKDTWSLEYLEGVMKRLVTESPEELAKELQETVPEFHRALNKKQEEKKQ